MVCNRSNALACANMARADYKHLIPLDEIIYAMNEVANAIPIPMQTPTRRVAENLMVAGWRTVDFMSILPTASAHTLAAGFHRGLLGELPAPA